MNKLTCVLLLCLLLLCPTVKAQDASVSAANSIQQPYKTAIGLQHSIGGIARNLTVKHLFWGKSGLELQVGHINSWQTYQSSLYYVWHPDLFRSERLRPYIGMGPSAITSFYQYDGPYENFQYRFGITSMVGLEYNFRKIPVALSIDYRPHLLDLGGNHKHRNFKSNGGFSVGAKLLLGR